MRYIKNNDVIFDNLISAKNEYIYNLFYLMREADDETYIIGKSNGKSPIWVFLNQVPDDATDTELSDDSAKNFAEQMSNCKTLYL